MSDLYKYETMNIKLTYVELVTALTVTILFCACSNSPCPKFEKRFPTKELTVDAEFSKDGKDHVIKYSSMEEAEWKLITCYLDEDDYDNDAVIGWFDYNNWKQIICSDQSSMTYPFEKLVGHLPYAKIVDSDDGQIRFYGMEYVQYDFACFIQYKQGDKVLLFEPENIDGYVDTIYYIKNREGELYYVPVSHSYYGFGADACVNAYKISNNGLVSCEIFDTEEGLEDYLCFSEMYAGAECYFNKKDAVLHAIIENCGIYAGLKTYDYIWSGDYFEKLIGVVESRDGNNIYLTESHQKGIPSVKVCLKEGDELVETSAFKVGGSYKSEIESVAYETWRSSNPNGDFFVFNSVDNTLYIPLIESNMRGDDRYLVYQFDGGHFVFKRKDGGYWLNPSLRQFEALETYATSPDYLIRIDKLEEGNYRYSSWEMESTMSDIPDLVISGGKLIKGRYEFSNEGYKYVLDTDEYKLRVYHHDKLILNQYMSIWENNSEID